MRTASCLLIISGLCMLAGLSAAERTYVSEAQARCFAWTDEGVAQGHWECDVESEQCFCVVDAFNDRDPVSGKPGGTGDSRLVVSRLQVSPGRVERLPVATRAPDQRSSTTVRTALVSVSMSRPEATKGGMR